MKSLREFRLLSGFCSKCMGSHFLILIIDISSDAESRKEQDGAKHFIVQSTMAELWLNLCEDVGEKEEESLLLVFQAFLRTDAFIRDVCRCDHSNQNLMVSNNNIKSFILGLIRLKLSQFV